MKNGWSHFMFLPLRLFYYSQRENNCITRFRFVIQSEAKKRKDASAKWAHPSSIGRHGNGQLQLTLLVVVLTIPTNNRVTLLYQLMSSF